MNFGDIFAQGHLKQPIKVSSANANDFKGEWLAIVDEQIVAHHRDIGKIIDVTQKYYKNKRAEFVRINAGNVAMY